MYSVGSFTSSERFSVRSEDRLSNMEVNKLKKMKDEPKRLNFLLLNSLFVILYCIIFLARFGLIQYFCLFCFLYELVFR